MNLSIQRIDQAEFDSLREEWNQLLSQSASDNIFLRWEWIHTWWSIFNHARSLSILTARSDGALIGIAPFYIASPQGVTQARVLRFCSDELSPDYMDLIVAKDHEAPVVEAFMNYWRHHTSSDMMVLEALLKDSLLLRYASQLPSKEVRITPALNCPYVKIEGSLPEYMEQRQKAAKISEREFKKKKEKLFKDHGVTHVIVDQESFLPKAINDLFFLHAKRSDAKGIDTNFASGPVREFHLRLCHLLLREGLLNMQFFYQGDKPLSVDYMYKYQNKFYCYQKGMDPQWSKLSVGTILLYDIITQAFAGGISEVDFLKGEERYKATWTDTHREQYDLRIYQTTFRGKLLNRLHRGKERTKSILKPLFENTRRYFRRNP